MNKNRAEKLATGAARAIRGVWISSIYRHKRWVLLALVAAVGLLLVPRALRVQASPGADELAIRQVCMDAMVARQTLALPPSSYHGGAMASDLQRQMLDRVPAVLSRDFTGEALANESNSIQAAIRRSQDGKIRYLDSGVTSADFEQILLNNDTAIVTVQAVTWAKLGQDQGNGKLAIATPHNTVDFTFTLMRVNSRWLINGFSWSFAPGSEP